MTAWELDVEKLATAVTTVMRYRDLSERKAAAELGFSPSTLNRLKQGGKPDADSIVTLLIWLNADVRDFAKPALPTPVPSPTENPKESA